MPGTDPTLNVPAPVVGVSLGWRTWLVIVLSTALGLFAIGWPLLIPAVGVAPEHAQDAPFVFAALLPVILLLVIAQVTEGGLDSRSLAVLGVLSAINAAIRPALGAGTAGVESVFFLLVLAGRAFGPGFGYLLGMTSLFASALITAGVGPWLPFQMLAAGWVGLISGLLPRRVTGKAEIGMLIAVGVVSAYVYGALMNMWFWPFITGINLDGAGGSLDYVPGAPIVDNLARFGWFTLLTSTGGWDTGRAITTALALLILGRPLLTVLRRASGLGRVAPHPGEAAPQRDARVSPLG
ncbi:ECF transporter S component [Tessaracoccus flavus]|uniref:ECF transporter S component n=1 Tax=Tessaracoccus flavus TaxID=1610493 RepID=UPI000898C17D|nr:ECF transporter S component [Tessaracoccus flavus]SDY96453.1 energy-coupling factor transport system substrate-specific component [Tessaracoccus flavus]